MDLVYIPEVLTYGSFRCPQYRDYEQPWNKDYFSCGKTLYYRRRQQEPHDHRQKTVSKDNCPMCKESKRRSLAAYIRSKSRNSCQEICEEEEEGENVNVDENTDKKEPACIQDSDKKTKGNNVRAKVAETRR